MMGYQTNPNFSMFYDQDHPHYDYDDLSSSTSVDCTLSLATPSTRLDEHSRFCSANSNNISGDFYFHGGSAKTTSYKKGGSDHNIPRRCASCDTTSTPLWRNGPKGPKSLCNACGIRFKKEERRAAARNSITSGVGSSMTEVPAEPYNGGGNYYTHHHHYASSSPSWAHQNTQRVQYFSPPQEMEYPFVGDVSTASFLSWN
ncbi:unnamed protein product [Eruca vesicaria subsp. sativa]|uniref:GATA-type domain-containing protein n=1 Tax=Eruca vesicaria subsp. sativa TaxID=29727 RepID=A0ABC8LHC4_ERUVS|nr:unnamed protein product [Eruca vesicaria subsp. sativa]